MVEENHSTRYLHCTAGYHRVLTAGGGSTEQLAALSPQANSTD
jgi:hypothetical protein